MFWSLKFNRKIYTQKEITVKNLSFFGKLMFFYKPFLGNFFVSWILIALFSALIMIFPYAIGKIIDHAINSNKDAIYIWTGIGCFSLFIARIPIRCIGAIYHINNIYFDIVRKFRHLSLIQMTKLSVGQHQNQNSGLKQDIVLSGSDSLNELSNLIVNNLSFMALKIIVGLIIFSFHSPVLMLINATSITIYVTISVYFNNLNSSKLDKMINLRNSSQKKYTDYIRNITLLLLNANAKSGMKSYDEARQSYEDEAKPFWIKYIIFMRIGDFLEVITISIVLFYCISLYLSKDISVGEISIYLMWSKMITESIGNFNNSYERLIKLSIDIKKFFQFLDIEPAIITQKSKTNFQRIKGSITFQNVSFKYPNWSYFKEFETDDIKSVKKQNQRTISDDVSFEILAKEKVAFVGMSGAGKSTLISLLMRSYDPQSGDILVDGINIQSVNPKNLRENIGLIEQDIQLMDDTLRANLLIGLNGNSKAIGDEDLWEVLSKANLTLFKEQLTDGLDTKIGERGVKLSGGEKQRVAIARALLKEAPIMIFDEATSNLDSVNEDEIHKAMFKAGENSTCIFIAHRLSTVKNVDKIFVLDKGKVIAEGKHSELVKDCNIYKKLVKKQIVAF